MQTAEKNSEFEVYFTLKDLIEVFFKHIKKVIIFTFITSIIVAIVSLFLPKVYQSSANLLIHINPLKTDFTPENFSVPAMEPILRSDDILEAIIKKCNLVKYNSDINVKDFRKNLSVRIYIKQDTNVRKEYVPLVTLYAKGPTPKVAKEIVNTWAKLAAKRINDTLSSDILLDKNIIEKSYKITFDSLNKLNKQVIQLQTEIPLLEKQLDDLNTKKIEYIGKLQDTIVEISKTKNSLIEYKNYLESSKNILRLHKTITDDALWQAILSENKKLKETLKSSLVNEVLNPVYTKVKSEQVSLQATLKGLLAQKKSYEESLKKLEEKINTLSKEINSKKNKLAVLEKEKDILQNKYDKYSKDKIQLDIEAKLISQIKQAEKEGNYRFVKIMNWGVANKKRIAPKRTLIVLSSTIVAFTFYLFLFILIELFNKLYAMSKIESKNIEKN